MKKKTIALLVSASSILALAGCSSKNISNDYIAISEYKGVKIDKIATQEVTDKDIEAAIQSSLDSNKITNEVTDRPVQDKDVTTIDYVGKMDGVEFEGGSATDYPLTIGSGSFIEGFESAIIGHSIGETFDVPLTFPDPYSGNPDYSGKAVVFTTTIKSIATETLPELNDKFVKSVTQKESKTVKEYKSEVQEELIDNEKANRAARLEEASWAKVAENIEVKKLPKDKVKEAQKQIKDQYTQMAKNYQLEFPEFLKTFFNGMTEEQFKDESKKVAESAVKDQLAIELIADKQRLTPTKKEYEDGYKKLAKDYGFKDVKALKEAAPEKELKKMILDKKVKNWVAANCRQVEPKKEEPKKEDTKTEDKKAE